MRQRRRIVFRLATAAAVLLVAIVAGNAAMAGESATRPPIKIGVDMALTGPFAVIGTAEKNGIVLAARQINAKGGINGRKIALTILDDASSPTTAVTNANRLISDGVVAIVGPNAGPLVAAGTPVTTRNNVLQFVGSASDIQGTVAGPTVFFFPPQIHVWSSAMACYMKKTFRATRVAGIYSTDPAGIQAEQGLERALRRLGMTYLGSQSVDLTATDTSVQWTKIRETRPDAVANMVTGALAGTTMKTARQFGITAPVVGYQASAQPTVWRLAETAGEGAVIATAFTGTDPTRDQKVFVNTYLRNYGTAPDVYNAFGYDMMNLTAAALARVPNPTQKKGLQFARALERTAVKGVMLNYRFGRYDAKNPNTSQAHTAIKVSDVLFVRVRNGNFFRAPAQPKC